MAFDGSVVAALTDELNKKIINNRITRIIQPQKDELLISTSGDSGKYKLLISVNPSLPVAYLTDENKKAPEQAPAFCMLLRKHIQSGRIISISQPSLERIINIEIEHFNDMGDICTKILTIELMGKHSNIIFRDGERIIDSIRHVSSLISSVREVLPGRTYFIPFADSNLNPFDTELDTFTQHVCTGALPLYRSIYTNITGFSPALAEEVAYNAGIDGERNAGSLAFDEILSLYRSFKETTELIRKGTFAPEMLYKDTVPDSFCAIHLNINNGLKAVRYDSISELLITFYSSKQEHNDLKQRTAALRQSVQSILAKDYKKYDIQSKQIKDTEKKDKYKLYGELLTAYGYSIPAKSTSYTCTDFYTGADVTIPLDPTLSAIDNGKKYFEKYSKLKRTADHLDKIIKETSSEIEHLESISVSLDTAADERDIADIRNEMQDAGYIKLKQVKGKKVKTSRAVSAPLCFISSDGFDIYVGKNNYQNEYITFKLADGGDWWFHAKKIPGSHVIVKCGGRDLPDRTFEEAARLAAHFSKSGCADKVEIDYVQRKYVKKPAGAAPGFVIYHTNYSMTASTDISGISVKGQ